MSSSIDFAVFMPINDVGLTVFTINVMSTFNFQIYFVAGRPLIYSKYSSGIGCIALRLSQSIGMSRTVYEFCPTPGFLFADCAMLCARFRAESRLVTKRYLSVMTIILMEFCCQTRYRSA